MSARIDLKLIENDPPADFTCGIESIDSEIRESYFATLLKQAYGYQILNDSKVVGYCLINIENIIAAEYESIGLDYESSMNIFFSAFHIQYIAIDISNQRNGKKYGTNALREIMKMAINMSEKYPIRFISIDAKADLVDWYENKGFKCIRNDGYTSKMLMDCWSPLDGEKIEQYQEKYVLENS